MKALLRQCFFISIITEDFALKHTTNYALPDWEKSDFIQMSDFNDLTHKLDTALKSHDDTLNTKADTSSVTAVQQEVAAAREANCLVKLAGPLVTTAANAAMEFDLSQVDMTKVARCSSCSVRAAAEKLNYPLTIQSYRQFAATIFIIARVLHCGQWKQR